MLALWLPTDLHMLEDIPQYCPDVEDLHFGCFGRPGAQSSALSAFNIFSTYITNTDQHQDSVQWDVLGLSE